MNGWKVCLAWATGIGTSTATGAGSFPASARAQRGMPGLDGHDSGRGRERLRREADRLPVVDAEPGLLERYRCGDELRGVGGRIAEAETGAGARARPERGGQVLDVRLLLGADDLSELPSLAGELSAGKRRRIERGLKSLDQQPVREDLAVGRGRAARIRRRGQLGAADCGTGQRTDYRNRSLEQTSPRHTRRKSATSLVG